MKTAVIANPHSSSGKTGKRLPRIQQAIESRLGKIDVRLTEGIGHATVLAAELLGTGYERIIGVGGDGTFNEIANGFLRDDQPRNPAACLGILPMGTGGDFRRSLGIGAGFDDALDVLATGKPLTIDLGKVTYESHDGRKASRYFVNVVSLGMGGEVSARAKNFLSFLGGQAAFFYATLKVFAIYRGKPVELSLDDGPPRSHRILNIAIGNGTHHGGGMHVCPEAVFDDGLLEVTVIDDLGILTLMKDVSYLYNGNIHAHPKISHSRARRVRATSPEATLIEVDGEPLGRLPLEFTILPRRLAVLAPARNRFS